MLPEDMSKESLPVKPALIFAACLGLAVMTSPLAVQAYEGLMPGSQSGDGYDGLLAPSSPTGGNRNTTQPPGYEGVMPGHVPQRQEQSAPEPDNAATQPARGNTAASPAARAPAAAAARRPAQTARPELPMTPRPGRLKLGNVSSAEQLRLLASLAGKRLDLEKMTADIKPSAALLGLPDAKRPRTNNMLPMELMAKNQIDKTMAVLNNPRLTPEQKKLAAQQSYEQMKMLADGIITRRSVPEAIYKKMGMSEQFLQEEREGNERALARFEEAFKILRPLQ